MTATGGGSGNPVAFSIDPTATTVCSLTGPNTISFVAGGICVIDANQAGNASFAPAPQAQQSLPVGLANQTITFTSTPPANASVGGPTYTVVATGGGSGIPVVFSIDPAATAVCDLSGPATVSFAAAGTCVIDANQAGNANYTPAQQAQQSFPVSLASQTISFTAPASGVVNGSTVLSPTASSGLSVTLTVDPADESP